MGELISEIYACADAPARWQAVLDEVCGRMRVRSAAVQVLEERAGRYSRVWEARDSYSFANGERHDRVLNNDQNPRLRSAYGAPPPEAPEIVRDEDVFSPGSPELADIRRRLKALDFGDSIRSRAELSPRRFIAFVVHRSASVREAIGAEEQALMTSLLPHIRQSVRLMDKLHSAKLHGAMLAGAADLLAPGMLLCDLDGRVHWSNGAADAVLGRSPHITRLAGRLWAPTSAGRAALTALLAQAGDQPRGQTTRSVQLTLGGLHTQDMVQLLAFPAVADSEELPIGSRPAVVLLLCEPDRRCDLSSDSLADLFGLSPAEARLTAGLCDGLSLSDYARARGISVGTARIQLKRALAKTNSPRQSELVRRVYASVAAHLHARSDAPAPPRPSSRSSRSS